MLLKIILATIFVSLISLVGILISYKKIKGNLHYLISFSAAVLISVSFFDLIPHALEELELGGIHLHESIFFLVIGIILFFLFEKFIHWHHCGKQDCDKKPLGALILSGDFLHNFIDGILIAGAFLLDPLTGIIITLSVIIHEIPQEIGDFAVLIHSGYTKKRALFLNFLSALSSVLGGILGYFLLKSFESFIPFVVLITAGGFIYIALSDIIPELHKHKGNKINLIETSIFVLTIILFKFILEILH